MSSYYNSDFYRCGSCGLDKRACSCGQKQEIKSPSSYIRDIRREKGGNRVTAIDQSNNIDIWYSAMIRAVDEVGGDLVLTMVTGETHTVPLYKGISPDHLREILSGYVTNAEFCVYREEMKKYIEANYVNKKDLEIIIDNLKCFCKNQCNSCGSCSSCTTCD